MIWKKWPHFPEEGKFIFVQLKGCKEESYYKIKVLEGKSLNHINKWCYEEEMNEFLSRKHK